MSLYKGVTMTRVKVYAKDRNTSKKLGGLYSKVFDCSLRIHSPTIKLDTDLEIEIYSNIEYYSFR